MKRKSLYAAASLLVLNSCFSYPATRFEEVRSLPGQTGVKLTQPDSRMSDTSFARSRDGLWGVLYGDFRSRNLLVYFTMMEKRLIHFGIVDANMRVVQQAIPIHSEAMGKPGLQGVGQGLFAIEKGFLIAYLAGDDLVSCEYDIRTKEIVNRRRIGNVTTGAGPGASRMLHHADCIYIYLNGVDSASLVRADIAAGKSEKVRELTRAGWDVPAFVAVHAGGRGMYSLVRYNNRPECLLYYDSPDGAKHNKWKIEYPESGEKEAAGGRPLRADFFETGGDVSLVLVDGNNIWRKKVTAGEGIDAPYEKVHSSVYSIYGGNDAIISSISCTDTDCYALISTYSTGLKQIFSFRSGKKKDVSSHMPISIRCNGSRCLCETSFGDITFLPQELLE